MKRILTTILTLMLLAAFCTACGQKKQMYVEEQESTSALSETAAVTETPEQETEQLPPETTEAPWDGTILGMTFDPAATEIDLTPVIARAEGEAETAKTAYQYGLEFRVMGQPEENPSAAKVLPDHPLPDKTAQTEALIAEAEMAMVHFPNAEKLVMCGAWLDNERMSAFRERHRGEYKVVWSVECGDIAVRTDGRIFMPTKYFVPEEGFTDEHSYNLRYCEDMVCMDFGHMMISNLDFAAFMPKLKYLVLTLTPVYDITPLTNCKELVFLELAWSYVTDYSPLLECTALEDLNIGKTYGKIDPVLEMTWLKNLWMMGMKESYCEQAKQALPDTTVSYSEADPVYGQWRELPNYYAMRDELKMFYME